LGEGAVSGVVAKGGKVLFRKSAAIVDDKRVHMPVGRVVVMDRGHKLDGVA